MQTGHKSDGEKRIARSLNHKTYEFGIARGEETRSQYQSSRSVLRMNGIVYIILEEYNTCYEMGERDNSYLHNNGLLEYSNR